VEGRQFNLLLLNDITVVSTCCHDDAIERQWAEDLAGSLTRGTSSDLSGHSVSQHLYDCSFVVRASTSKERANAACDIAISSGSPGADHINN
jgi:hypothetical protein